MCNAKDRPASVFRSAQISGLEYKVMANPTEPTDPGGQKGQSDQSDDSVNAESIS